MLSNKDYRAHDAISRSELWQMHKTPFHFKYNKEHPQEDTPALLFGRACHKYILEEDDFYNEFAVAPMCDRRTKEGKAIWNEFVETSQDKDLIPRAEFEKIVEMADVIKSNPMANALIHGDGAIHEKSFFWRDSGTGIECKCRPDCIVDYDGRKYIVDYKTTDSCEDGHFERSARKYGYRFQAGMYREGVFQNTYEDYGFAFVAQEKKAPYAVRVYFCTEDYISNGLDEFMEYITIYSDCLNTDNWWGYEGPMGLETTLDEREE